MVNRTLITNVAGIVVATAAAIGIAGYLGNRLHEYYVVERDVNNDGLLDYIVSTAGELPTCFINLGEGKYQRGTLLTTLTEQGYCRIP